MRGRRAPTALLLAVALAASASCQAIVGIEDRTYDPESASSALCQEYCDTVLENCEGQYAVYTGRETCLGVCSLLEGGDSVEPAGNTVACRLNQARLARTTSEQNVHCRRAGPGGDDICGDNCESYCQLLEQACPAQHRLVDDCEQKCGVLRDVNMFDLVVNYDGDTLQCRLVHMSSATVDPDRHCEHAQLAAWEPCIDPPDEEPRCQDYCQAVTTACAGEFSVYESEEQCLAVCAALPRGKNGDTTEQTVGCRRYHTYNSLADPLTHCSHAGPGGDGHCGLDSDPITGNCEAYCILLEQACAEFSTLYANVQTCSSECTEMADELDAFADSFYSIDTAEDRPTLQCRLLYVSRALEDDTHCESALGRGQCQ